jgi:hypothetical protein
MCTATEKRFQNAGSRTPAILIVIVLRFGFFLVSRLVVLLFFQLVIVVWMYWLWCCLSRAMSGVVIEFFGENVLTVCDSDGAMISLTFLRQALECSLK